MKKFILLSLIAALPALIYAQTIPVITPQDYYDFYNSIGGLDTAKEYYLENKTISFKFLNHDFIDSLLKPGDSSFYSQQEKAAKNFSWEAGKLIRAKIIDSNIINSFFKDDNDSGWPGFWEKYGRHGFWNLSIPCFSKDKRVCMFVTGLYCGEECGEGMIYYFKKVGNKWKLVYQHRTWVS